MPLDPPLRVGLHEPPAGLRPRTPTKEVRTVKLIHDSIQPHHTQLVIPPGAELEVPESIALQLRQESMAFITPEEASKRGVPTAADPKVETQEQAVDTKAPTQPADAHTLEGDTVVSTVEVAEPPVTEAEDVDRSRTSPQPGNLADPDEAKRRDDKPVAKTTAASVDAKTVAGANTTRDAAPPAKSTKTTRK